MIHPTRNSIRKTIYMTLNLDLSSFPYPVTHVFSRALTAIFFMDCSNQDFPGLLFIRHTLSTNSEYISLYTAHLIKHKTCTEITYIKQNVLMIR